MLIDLNNANKVETSTSAATGLRRSTKTKQIPSTLHDFEVLLDFAVVLEGELVHYAQFVEFDLISFIEAKNNPKWVNTMEYELNSTEKNQT